MFGLSDNLVGKIVLSLAVLMLLSFVCGMVSDSLKWIKICSKIAFAFWLSLVLLLITYALTAH